VIVLPGGKNCAVALDKDTGETVWTSSGLEDRAHYSSFIKAAVGGVEMYITMTANGVVGLAADDGRFLWRYENTANRTAVIPTPVFHEGYVYSTSGYGTGCGLVKLTAGDGQVTAEEVYFSKDMKNHHGGVVLKDGKIYGYGDSGGWICQDLLSGDIVWRERSALGKGSIAFADNRLYCFTENEGTVVLAAASPDGWKEHGRFTIPERTQLDHGSGKTWTHPVIAAGRLFLRDQDLLFCYDITD
jgi:outer membrane protein assembly factor BamB